VTVDDVFDSGVLPLGTDGCGLHRVLVVSGAHRGHVWQLTDVGAAPFGREFGGTTAASGVAGWVRHRHGRARNGGGIDWFDALPDDVEPGGPGSGWGAHGA
jgi:hypothetical protein